MNTVLYWDVPAWLAFWVSFMGMLLCDARQMFFIKSLSNIACRIKLLQRISSHIALLGNPLHSLLLEIHFRVTSPMTEETRRQKKTKKKQKTQHEMGKSNSRRSLKRSSEISWEATCCRKATVETLLTVGERSPAVQQVQLCFKTFSMSWLNLKLILTKWKS